MFVSLDELYEALAKCECCPLRETATQPVPGLGRTRSKYMLIGEAPGREEDAAGVPFVGKAGRRLNELLALAKIDPNDCYITNVVRCRPPDAKGKNRAPKKREIRECVDWLWHELALVKPEHIIVVGSTPLALFTTQILKNTHGCMFQWTVPDAIRALWADAPETIPVTAQYHPAAAFKQPRLWSQMRLDWEFQPDNVPHDFTFVDPQLKSSNYPRYVALDTENAEDGSLGHWSIAYRDAEKRLVVEPFYKALPRKEFHEDTEVIFHFSNHDLRVLDKANMKRPAKHHCTMIGAYCLGMGRQDKKGGDPSEDAGIVGGLSLKYLAPRHLGMQMDTWQEVKDRGYDDLTVYNAKDSVATLLLFEKWLPNLPEHYFKIDMPLNNVLMKMEDRGIMVDVGRLDEYKDYLLQELESIELPFNPASTKQLGDYIYNKLKIEPYIFTKTGQPSVAEEAISHIDDPIVKKVLRWKELKADTSNFTKNYRLGVDETGRIHTEFRQTRTATGRLSSASPNLQNVPKEGQMRTLFVAPRGHKLIRVDWKQLEFYFLAAVTQDPGLLKAVLERRSVHQETSDSTGLKYDDAKRTNFLIEYGGSPYKMSMEFGITIDEANRFFKEYFEKFPGVGAFIAHQREIAHTEKRVTNYFGRTIILDSAYAKDWKTQRDSEKEAINYPIQGGAGEVVKLAMIDLDRQGAPMLLQVHDELIFEVPEKEAEEYARYLQEYIPTITEVNGVQFPVEVGIGNNWLEAMKGVI